MEQQATDGVEDPVHWPLLYCNGTRYIYIEREREGEREREAIIIIIRNSYISPNPNRLAQSTSQFKTRMDIRINT